MSEICACDSYALGNMGVPDCAKVAAETRQLILAPYFKSAGTVQSIAAADALTTVYWNTHVQRYDNSGALVTADNRWYITPVLENPEDVRAEDTFQEFNSGARYFVREGVRTFTAYIVEKATPELLAKIKRFGCEDMGVLLVDNKGNIIGNGSEATKLRFLKINRSSFRATLVKATGGSAVQMIMITFELDRLEEDHDLKMINAADMTVSPFDLNPLIDLTGTVVGTPTTTGFVINLKTSYGSFQNPIGPNGLVAADFVLTELAPTPCAITITSVTESTPASGGGVNYTFVIPTQTSGDTFKLVLKKVGYDAEALEAVVIEIP